MSTSNYPKSPCYQCPVGYNAINGRYCPKLKAYVEYAVKYPCKVPFSKND